MVDPFGHRTDADYDPSQRLVSLPFNDGIVSSIYTYTYVPAGENAGLLESATLAVNGVPVRQAQYDTIPPVRPMASLTT